MPGVSQLQPHLYASVMKSSPGRQEDGNTERTATESNAQKHWMHTFYVISNKDVLNIVLVALFHAITVNAD